MIRTTLSSQLIDALQSLVGPAEVIIDPEAQARFVKDFHWYSPLLTDALADKTADAVVRPGTLDELRPLVALAVEHRVPITFRGAGTGNYGQSRPLEGGLLVDVRRLNRVISVNESSITVECGTVMEDRQAVGLNPGSATADDVRTGQGVFHTQPERGVDDARDRQSGCCG
ncbi:MAG: hypothetical protein NVSMB2_25920 [Chloroflexota bacterium]